MKRLGIFFFYEKNGDVDDFITYYLADLNKNLTTIRTTLGGGSIVCDNRYTYDGNGNRQSKADRQGLTKYAYDANNQLVQVQYPQGGLENYSYDAVSYTHLTLPTNSRV